MKLNNTMTMATTRKDMDQATHGVTRDQSQQPKNENHYDDRVHNLLVVFEIFEAEILAPEGARSLEL
jgi:hypothetical protein